MELIAGTKVIDCADNVGFIVSTTDDVAIVRPSWAVDDAYDYHMHITRLDPIYGAEAQASD